MLSTLERFLSIILDKIKFLLGLSFHMSLRRRGQESYGADISIDASVESQEDSQPSIDRGGQ